MGDFDLDYKHGAPRSKLSLNIPKIEETYSLILKPASASSFLNLRVKFPMKIKKLKSFFYFLLISLWLKDIFEH